MGEIAIARNSVGDSVIGFTDTKISNLVKKNKRTIIIELDNNTIENLKRMHSTELSLTLENLYKDEGLGF